MTTDPWVALSEMAIAAGARIEVYDMEHVGLWCDDGSVSSLYLHDGSWSGDPHDSRPQQEAEKWAVLPATECHVVVGGREEAEAKARESAIRSSRTYYVSQIHISVSPEVVVKIERY